MEELGLAPVWRSRDGEMDQGRDEALAGASAEVIDSSVPLPISIGTTGAAGADSDRPARIVRMDWPALKQSVEVCDACGLHKSRKKTVFGVGDETADWLLIGEAPGVEEDACGEPFVGQAGLLLDNMIAAIGLARGKNVYLSNILKCSPPGNRNPDPGEVAQCRPYLSRQLALIRPKLILAMGRFATQALLGTDANIVSLRGRVHTYEGVPVIVTYHPTYLLRTPADKFKAWEDLCLASKTMHGLLSGAQTPSD